MNEPKLRFKADDGSQFPDWEEKKIGELGTFIKGAPLSKADISECGSPLILYGELYTTYKEVAYNIQRKTQAVVDEKYYSCIGDVIIPTSGESAEDISTATCVMTPGVVLGGDLNIFRSNILDGRIVSYILNHQAKWKIAVIAQGKSIVHIQAKQLSNIPVKYPVSKAEQQKIAEFLSTIDTVIEKQKETVSAWEERKKGMMQKLFSQEVRFKADDGSNFPDWEKKKIGDVFDVTRGYVLPVKKTREVSDNEYKYPVYSSQTKNNGLMGFYNQKLYENAITWTTDGANAGKTVYRNEEFYCTNVCGVLLDKKGNHNANDCIANMIDTISKKYVSYVGNPKLMNNVMSEIEIDFPCPEEQQKIADCLSSLDEVIEKQKAILAVWEELKKGLLQQMFV
mgnify:CR=1 FL=1